MVKNVCCNFYHSVERSGCDVSGVISIKGKPNRSAMCLKISLVVTPDAYLLVASKSCHSSQRKEHCIVCIPSLLAITNGSDVNVSILLPVVLVPVNGLEPLTSGITSDRCH